MRLVLIAGLVVLGGAVARAEPPPTDWRSTSLRDHPLVGTIWSARDGNTVTESELATRIGKAKFVLLGEVHDNSDHHRLQAWAIAAGGRYLDARRPAPTAGWTIFAPVTTRVLAMEMLNEDQRGELANGFTRDVWTSLEDSRHGRDAKRRLDEVFHEESLKKNVRWFGRALDWDASGWPPFEMYAPIIEQALLGGLGLAPASPSPGRTKMVSAEGLTVLGEQELGRLGLDQPFEPSLAGALQTEMRDSHCGLLQPGAAGRMAEVQRFRDAVMADALLSGGSRGAILIAGNGHVRRDRGAPNYLQKRGARPDEIISVMHIEVEEGKTDPAAYVPRAPDGTPAVDYLWFTPRQERPDPCEGLRKDLDKREK